MELLFSEQVREFFRDRLVPDYGPVASGALFGAGWWFWVDAVCTSRLNIPFYQWLPGIVASLSIIMINIPNRGRDDYEYDEQSDCRLKTWLFLSYLMSLGAIIGSVAVLVSGYAKNAAVDEIWPGVAVVFQSVLIILSGLVYFITVSAAYDNNNPYSSL